MRLIIHLLIISAFGSVLLFACKKDEVKLDRHEAYFGLEKNRFVTYEVMEIDHNIDHIIPHDTVRYLLKTVVGDTFIDNQGRVAREFLRYKRNNVNELWQQTDLWTAIIADNRAELIEENLRSVKLVFPLFLNKSWNANVFNGETELDCYMNPIHVPLKLGGLIFDSTLTVEQEDFFSMIDYRRKSEVYAKGIGLVKKYYKDLKINSFDTLNIVKGKELFYTCTGFGFQ